jgi:dihydroxyacetone kinase
VGRAARCTRECAAPLRGIYLHASASIFFSALAQGLQAAAGASEFVTPNVWSSALLSALAKLYTYTRARAPSRTLVDPLDAFVAAFAADPASVRAAVADAAEAAERTRDVEAKAGRSAYVESDVLMRERVPDPGAWGVKVILEALVAQAT